jgi:hypothetical protein
MYRISFSRFVVALGSIVCAVLLLAQPTLADGGHDFADSVGENPAALDIAHVLVDNDNNGNITVMVTFRSLSNLPSDSELVLLLDTDQNRNTGDRNGMEYEIWDYGEDNTYEFLRWNGTDYDVAGELTITNLPIVGVWIVLNRSQIGDVGTFNFAAATVRGPDDAPIIDLAPDLGTWTYQLVRTPVIASVVPAFRPAQPKAGGVFTAGARVTLDSGETVPATGARCKAQLGGKPLPATESAGCTFRIPKNAKGKRLVVTITASYEDAPPATTKAVFRVH